MSMGLISVGMHNMSILQLDGDKVPPLAKPDGHEMHQHHNLPQ
jgi:hypothetical protein